MAKGRHFTKNYKLFNYKSNKINKLETTDETVADNPPSISNGIVFFHGHLGHRAKVALSSDRERLVHMLHKYEFQI